MSIELVRIIKAVADVEGIRNTLPKGMSGYGYAFHEGHAAEIAETYAEHMTAAKDARIAEIEGLLLATSKLYENSRKHDYGRCLVTQDDIDKVGFALSDCGAFGDSDE